MVPFIITLSIRFVPKEYGKYAIEEIGFVKMRFAFLPMVMLPTSFCKSIANAPLIVEALMASSGSIRIPIQLIAVTKFIFPEGDEPGYESDARAMAHPDSINCLAS